MKRTIAVILLAALIPALAAGCSRELPEGMDEEEVTRRVHEVIETVFAGDFEAYMDMTDDLFHQAYTVQEMADTLIPLLEDAGELEEITKTVVAGGETDGAEYATAVVSTKCSGKDKTFTISIDPDMRVCGFYIK